MGERKVSHEVHLEAWRQDWETVCSKISFRFCKLHYITLSYIILYHITLKNITLHHIAICITLHILHYISLHYITLHYITLHVSDVSLPYAYGELEALGAALDIMKDTAKHSVKAYKHAMNKKVHTDSASVPDSYDPAVSKRQRCSYKYCLPFQGVQDRALK